MRLIDADLLMRSFQVDMCGSFTCHECPLWNEDGECGFEVFISDTPTVDAVEIVRCKDCKHWLKDVPGCTDFVGRCELANYMIGAVGYCVYGERRGDNAAD